MDSVEIKRNHQEVKKVLIVKQILTLQYHGYNVQCLEYACEHLGLKGLTIFFVVTGKVMMLAILAEKKKKKKLNERCVQCSAQKYQRSNLSLRMVIGIPGLWKVFACRIWNQGNFSGRIRNAGLWNPEFSLIDWNLEILSKFQR